MIKIREIGNLGPIYDLLLKIKVSYKPFVQKTSKRISTKIQKVLIFSKKRN